MAPFDTDDDGRWSLAEFRDGRMRQFDAVDSNHDQMLSGDELPDGAEPIARTEYDANAAARFEELDRDSDGFIDADELAESMRQRAASASAGE